MIIKSNTAATERLLGASINKFPGQYWRHYEGCPCLENKTEKSPCYCLSVVESTLKHIRKYHNPQHPGVWNWRFDEGGFSEYLDVRVMFQLADLGYLEKVYGCYNDIEFIYTGLTSGPLDN